MRITVTKVNWYPKPSVRAIVYLEDSTGNELYLTDYDGAELDVDWGEGNVYDVSNVRANNGLENYRIYLETSKKTRTRQIESRASPVELLVLGDTHVGRSTHPGDGESLNCIDRFRTAVEIGIERGVKAVVHVGDIFHESASCQQARRVNEEVFGPLATAGVPFYYVSGNHGSEPGTRLLEGRASGEVVNLDTTGVSVAQRVRLYGIDHHPTGEIPDSTLEIPNHRESEISVLVLHQTLQQLSEEKSKGVDLNQIQQEAQGSFDCVVSGHHHDAKQGDWDGRPALYTGAAERMSTNDDPTDRIAWFVTIDGGSVSCDRFKIP